MRHPYFVALAAALAFAACGPEHEDKDREARCNIPVVDEAAAKGNWGQPQGPKPEGVPASPPTAGGPSAAAPGSSDAAKATVKTYIQRLMDETRIVPDTAAKKGGPRGSPGSFAKLTSAQVDEFIGAIIYGAARYLPKSLTDEQRWALVCAEISIESAFQPGTSGANPGNTALQSVGPLQLTLGIWDDIFRQYAPGDGLTHYDGSPWSPRDTQAEALKNNIFDSVVASLWCITEQGRRGCPDWFGGPDGPCPKTMRTSFLAWVIGGPALKSGGDLAGQKDAYIASIETDLRLLGFDIGLVDAAF